ncbi:alpha-L-glutamate ligase [Anoxybacter fermentans]|uniref:Alpha-L-glutamate ligase n=1 Tax=Anoxybacter fermentans TaxID=1323375 RepID=A0A3S9T173_9FIRM|nr:hypothetical protein [Anoxybacter fermentans]AZR74172.1 alpha-L-glutamate ligase [Anoxybacter fermentans]
MRLVSFNPYRSIGVPGVRYIKPEMVFKHREEIAEADWILFPEYWQVNFLVYGLKKRIFPNINTYHLGHDKVEMTRAFWAVCPENTPYTQILASTDANIEQVLDEFTFPFVTKEVRNSMGRGVFLIENKKDFLEYAQKNSILYVQEYLPIDRDLRIVYLGDKVITAYWRIGAEGQFHNNVSRGGSISFDDIPEEAIRLVEKVARKLGINHAGFDVAEVDGHYYFLEFNHMFGNQALLEKKIPVGRLIYEYLQSQSIPPREPDKPLIPRAS